LKHNPQRIIGLTGLPSSGKGEVVQMLLDCAEKHGWRAVHLSYSKCIKQLALEDGHKEEEIDRTLLSQIATKLREEEGPGALSKHLVTTLAEWPDPKPELFVVEALRHPGEYKAMKASFDTRFTLVGVDSDLKIIAKRLRKRARSDEDAATLKSEKACIEMLERELNGAESEQSPNVGTTVHLAELRIENNGSLKDLQNEVDKFFTKKIMNGCRKNGNG
jgi:dephospho-CoA kinase